MKFQKNEFNDVHRTARNRETEQARLPYKTVSYAKIYKSLFFRYFLP